MPSEFSANRREFLKMAGAGLAALAAGSCAMQPYLLATSDDWLLPPAKKSRIYIISDIHMGDDSFTCWYQRRFHEPFLVRILDEIIDKREEVRELILLGDVMDFWTYVPEVRPPTFQQIAAAHPNIFGPDGKLVEVLRALEGRVTVLQGNHDMGFTQADWDGIRSPEGYAPRLIGDLYQPLGPADPRLQVAHGHLYTMFNAPDPSTPFAPLPVGHYVTRAVAHRVRNELGGTGRTAADLPGQGAPNGMDIARAFGDIVDDVPNAMGRPHDVVTLLLEMARGTCGLSDNTPIILPGGARSSLADAKVRYQGLWQRWSGGGREGGSTYMGDVTAMRAFQSDAQSKYLGWFAQRLAFQRGAELVVMGHTHNPVQGLITDPMQGRALCNYFNTGFGCPSEPDTATRSVSFGIVDVEHMLARTMRVRRSGAAPSFKYTIEPDISGADAIVYPPMMDFSTYITIDNSKGRTELVRTGYTERVGSFVVLPPESIAAGATASFWIQDRIGIQGSDGAVRYRNQEGANLEFMFECPSGVLMNRARASGARVFARSGGEKLWRLQGDVPAGGHPLFVRYVI